MCPTVLVEMLQARLIQQDPDTLANIKIPRLWSVEYLTSLRHVEIPTLSVPFSLYVSQSVPFTENSNLYFFVQELRERNGCPWVATAQIKNSYCKSTCKKSLGLPSLLGDHAPSPCSRALSGSKPTRDDEADKRWRGIAKLLVMPTACIWHAKNRER